MVDFLPQYNIYKPNTVGTGSGAQFKLTKIRDKDEFTMFLEMARQLSENPKAKIMDWDNTKVTIKLGLPDLEKIIHTLELKKSITKTREKEIVANLFHKNNSGSTTLNLKINDQQPGFYLTVSQAKEGQKKRFVSIPITPEESTGLKIALKIAFQRILGWPLPS